MNSKFTHLLYLLLPFVLSKLVDKIRDYVLYYVYYQVCQLIAPLAIVFIFTVITFRSFVVSIGLGVAQLYYKPILIFAGKKFFGEIRSYILSRYVYPLIKEYVLVAVSYLIGFILLVVICYCVYRKCK